MVALRDAARDLEIDGLVLEGLQRHDAFDKAAPLLPRIWIADADRGEAALEACEMLVEPERHLGIHRDDFVDAIAEDEAAIEHGHLGLGERQILAVQQNRRYLIHSLSVSQARPSRPAGPIGSSATSACSAI